MNKKPELTKDTLEKKLEKFNTDYENAQTLDEKQALITNHSLNKYELSFKEEIQLFLILKILEVDFELLHEKSEIKNQALVMALLEKEIFFQKKRRWHDF